jgi:O-antigen/teichoic acid export membrane protein
MIASAQKWVESKQQELLPANSLRARFTTAAFWSIAGAVISRGCVLLASIACARLLGETGFGELGMIQSTVGVFGIFAGLGLGLTATKFVSEFRDSDPERAGQILGLSSVTAIVSGAVMTLALVAASPYLAKHMLRAPQLAMPLALSAGLVFFGGLNGAQTGALIGLEAFRRISAINLWVGLATFFFVMVGTLRYGLRGAVAGFVAALAFNWLLNNVALRQECRRYGIQFQFLNCAKQQHILYRFTLPAFLASVIVGPAIWVCNAMLVNQPDGYARMGLYTAADKWRLLILFIPTSVSGTVLPILSSLYSSGDITGYNKILNANLALHFGLVALPAVAIAIFASPILSVYGAAYRSAWPILMILSFSAIPEALNNILGYAAIVSVSVWWRLWFDILLAATLLGFALWAIPRWAAAGLAGAYAAAFSLTAAGLALFLRGRSPDMKTETSEAAG